jgi:hypothetical protein
MLNCGDTFITGDNESDDWHLHVIITPPTDSDEVVTVCVTTKRKRSETLVVIPADSHPFVKHASVISYGYSKIRCVADIETAIQNGTAKKRDPVSAELLSRAQAGLIDSDFTPNGVKWFYKELLEDEKAKEGR